MILIVAATPGRAHRWARENKIGRRDYRVVTSAAGLLHVNKNLAQAIVIEPNKEVESELKWLRIPTKWLLY